MDENSLRYVSRVKRLSQVSGGVAIMAGVLALGGWLFDVTPLKQLLFDSVAIHPLLAVLLGILGAALLLMEPDDVAGRRLLVGRGLALLAAVVGILVLVGNVFAPGVQIDRMLFASQLAADGAATGQFGPLAALNIILLSLALVYLNFEGRVVRRLVEWMVLAVILLTLLVVHGYLYDIGGIFTTDVQLPMTFVGALATLILALGIVASRPNRGFTMVVMSDTVGGMMARRLLPAAVLAPFILSGLRVVGQRSNLFSREFGLALLTTANVVVIAGVIVWNARVLFRMDAERREASKKVSADRNLLRTVIDALPVYVYVKDVEGRLLMANAIAARALKFESPDQLVGKTEFELAPGPAAELSAAQERQVIETGEPILNYDRAVPGPDGQTFYMMSSKMPVFGADGSVLSIVGITHDVTERRRAENEISALNRHLEKQTAQLAAANHELEAFSYSVSHDLRAPLRAIEGFSSIVIDTYSDQVPPEALRYLTRVRESSQRMHMLIDDLLRLARVTRQPLKMAEVSPAQLARQVYEDLSVERDGRQVELSIAEDMPACEADPALLKQVYANLISNAIKFTGKRDVARIEVGCQESDGQRVYLVRDNGTGFDMRYVDKLFGVFQRLHRAEDYEGTGIGLATVQRIIHRHGGRIWAEAAVEQGATFYFTLGGRDEVSSLMAEGA